MTNQRAENIADRQSNVVSMDNWKTSRRLQASSQNINEPVEKQPAFTAGVLISLAIPFFTITSVFGPVSFLTVAYVVSLVIGILLVRFSLIKTTPDVENYFEKYLLPEVITENDTYMKKAA